MLLLINWTEERTPDSDPVTRLVAVDATDRIGSASVTIVWDSLYSTMVDIDNYDANICLDAMLPQPTTVMNE